MTHRRSRPTHVFDHAVVKGQTSKPAIKNGHITIRLQGIDATELHYQPSALSLTEKKGLSAAQLNSYHLLVHFYRRSRRSTILMMFSTHMADWLATSTSV